MKMLARKQCKACGYVWTPRVKPPKQPKECPRCKARLDRQK